MPAQANVTTAPVSKPGFAVTVRSYRHNSPIFVVKALTASMYINGFRIVNPQFKIMSHIQVEIGEKAIQKFIQEINDQTNTFLKTLEVRSTM